MALVVVSAGLASAQTVESAPGFATTPVPMSPPDRVGGGSGIIGVGPSLAPDSRPLEDYEAPLVPYARFDLHEYFAEVRPAMGALQLRANVAPSGQWVAGPLLNYRIDREQSGAKKVDQLERADPTWELGGFVGYQIVDPADPRTRFGVNVQVAGDLSDSHNGWSLQPGVDYTMALAPSWQLNARVFSTYASENYMNAYFGVGSKGTAKSGLDKFTAEAGFKDVGLGLGLGYNLTDNWNIGTQAGYSRLMGDAADSPVTKKDEGSANQFFGGIIINHRF